MARIRIGIAVVEHAGRYLVGIRSGDQPLAGCAEFPGGKCRPEESAADCAVRECAEETGLQVEVTRLLYRGPWDYPHAQVDLHFYLCRPASETLVQPRHGGFFWVPAAELRTLAFPAANEPVIQRLLGSAAT